ncbi:MAG: penicillin-binding transpeptidase domain-containing protein [Cellulosilyticaceae bacterium]
MKKHFNKLLGLFQERVFLVFVGISLLFGVLVLKFYNLQIVKYDNYATQLRASVERMIEIPSTRGLIFDRYGRPLAVNQPTKVLKVDQQVRMDKKQLNQVLLNVALLLEENGDGYVDKLPISQTEPFEYTGGTSTINQFMYSIPYNNEDHRQELLTYSADQIIDYLRSQFTIDESISDNDARKIIALRCEIYAFAYRKYKLVTIADNVSDETVAQIEENLTNFPGVVVDVEPVRYYPEGELLGNVLGYTRTITDTQYSEMQALGYDKDDIVGQDGIEKSMEEELRGKKGIERVEVDNVGRKVHTIEKNDAVQGNDVFLTIDLDLQRAAYDSIEQRLSEALVDRLKAQKTDIQPLKAREILISMVESSQLDMRLMAKAEVGTKQKEIYDIITKEHDSLDPLMKEDITMMDLMIQILKEDSATITDKDLILLFHEQGSMHLPESTVTAIKQNKYGSAEHILIQQLETGNLKPKQFAVDPFSATTVVVDVNTGEVLAVVGYPSFDSNQMTTNFNRYYGTLFDDRSMLWNRALMTTKAPGSTFKMITAIAGLEEGVVTPTTTIYDTGYYTRAGAPYPKCWLYGSNGGSHGHVDVTGALEVSCNIYFYEVAMRLGANTKGLYSNIETLTKYVHMFGLDQKTGIELAETEPNVSTPKNLVKSQITSVLGSLKNMSEDKRAKRVEDMGQMLRNGLYPINDQKSDSVDDQIDYLTQYELKRNIEPLLQEALDKDLSKVLDEAFVAVQADLQLNLSAVVDDIVTQTINDTSTKSLKSKARLRLNKHLEYMMKDDMQQTITQITGKIDVDDLLDAYDHAYNTLYTRELKKDPDSPVVIELRNRIESLEENPDRYVQMVNQKIIEGIVKTMSSYLLQGVEMEWSDGITIRTAIGQGNNAYSPIQMSRYIAAIANGKEVFDLRIVNGINDQKDSGIYEPKQSSKYADLDVSDKTIDVVHQGMLKTTQDTRGTARTVFSGFPVDVASKTGTAQEGGHEHSWFAAFAPYDNPQVAIVTSIYNADGLGRYGTQIARDVLTAYFEIDQESEKTTLDNMFIQ